MLLSNMATKTIGANRHTYTMAKIAQAHERPSAIKFQTQIACAASIRDVTFPMEVSVLAQQLA